jgi:hypothetical protein
MKRERRPRLKAVPLLLLFVAAPLFALPQGDAQGPDSRLSREQMWYAPTAEDWAKPCLLTFQRTWEDAVAISKETKKPILVCISMDGEIASEHYAGIRYRQPEIAALYEPYVCVIASVYRHTPRDYDEQGRRICCPRFGSVTCGEHIAIEPLLYEKFMDKRRIAPRHIMVELDGSEVYDVYHAFDTASVFKAIKDGIAERKDAPKPVVRGDRSLLEKVASRDVQDRAAVESSYVEGDEALRRALLEAARSHPEAAQSDLLRLAVRGLDERLAGLARKALAATRSETAIEVLNDALKAPLEPAERDALIGALDRIGETSTWARTLAVVHRGLGAETATVDVSKWTSALEGAAYTPASEAGDDPAGSAPAQTTAPPKDADGYVALAEDYLRQALEENVHPRFARALFSDARDAAAKAEGMGARGWRVNAAVAVASWYLGDVAAARARAEIAVADMPNEPESWNAMVALWLFADARREAIREAQKEKKPLSPKWIADVHATYAILAKHPFGYAEQVAEHYDFLRDLGERNSAASALKAGLSRFPEAWRLHDRYRSLVLEEKGVDGLEAEYEALLAAPGAPPGLAWYAGYASIVTAEHLRRARKLDDAIKAYGRAIAHYETAIKTTPENAETSARFIALALGGRARIAFERGAFDAAVADLEASFARDPNAAATQDGLNLSPVDTAKTLAARARRLGRDDVAKRVDAALAKLDPKMLELPAYERDPGPEGAASRPRAGRRRER